MKRRHNHKIDVDQKKLSQNKKVSRKQQRKQQRKQKKALKNFHYKKLKTEDAQKTSISDFDEEITSDEEIAPQKSAKPVKKTAKNVKKQNRHIEQLENDYKEEEQEIRNLEKKLKIKKSKSSIPKAFLNDGFGDLLELCKPKKLKKQVKQDSDDCSDAELDDDDDHDNNGPNDFDSEESFGDENFEDEEENMDTEDLHDVVGKEQKNVVVIENTKRATKGILKSNSKKSSKHVKFADQESSSLSEEDDFDTHSDETEENDDEASAPAKRTRVDPYAGASAFYCPPNSLKRQKFLQNSANTPEFEQLKRVLKGYLNRLSEGNMAKIFSNFRHLYASHSMHNMNSVLVSLLKTSLLCRDLMPGRILAEHACFIALLHNEVAIEIGAYVVRDTILHFTALHQHVAEHDFQLDNTVVFFGHLYHFHVINSRLVFDLIEAIITSFKDKDIELLHTILKTVGVVLRKRDSNSLKEIITTIQNRAKEVRNSALDKTKIDYILGFIPSLKAKSVTVEETVVDSLNKCVKGFLKVKEKWETSQLNVRLFEIVEKNAQYVSGVGWKFDLEELPEEIKGDIEKPSFDSQLLELARQQRMNTDFRRNVFCLIMSAEDYSDAFEKLMKLNIKAAQRPEVMHVIIRCCVNEKTYNPYYFHLLKRLLVYDTKLKKCLQFTFWEKFKVFDELNKLQMRNFIRLVGSLIHPECFSFGLLKVVNFEEHGSVQAAFMKSVILHVFTSLSGKEYVKLVDEFRNSEKQRPLFDRILLFIQHTISKNFVELASQFSVSVKALRKRVLYFVREFEEND